MFPQFQFEKFIDNKKHILIWYNSQKISTPNLYILIQQKLREMSESESDSHSNSSEQSVEQTQSNAKENKKRNNKLKNKIILNISDCQYPVVSKVAKSFGWKLQNNSETSDWDVCWTDNAVPPEMLVKMQSHQRINHFPGMFNLARKNLMGRYLMKMRKRFSEDYSFFPLTWMLPIEYHELKAYFETKQKGKARTFIVKPEAMSQGKGIFLTRKLEEIDQSSHCVVQRYLHRPYLIDGLKFDLRVYVLVASVDPLRLYIFEDGLARFATQKYQVPTKQNMEDTCMHLTNYAINKDNPKFIFNTTNKDMSKGHKRSLVWLYQYLQKNEPQSENIKGKIQQLIVKTMIAGLPPITNQYRSCQPENYSSDMCFELLGFDVMLTDKCEPVLLEINHTPSFTTDTPLDDQIKTNFIRDSLQLMNINQKIKNMIVKQRRYACQQRVVTGKKVKLTPEEKQIQRDKAHKKRQKYEDKNLGGLKRIFPINNTNLMEKYETFLDFSNDKYLASTGVKNKRMTMNPKNQKIESAFGTCLPRKHKGNSKSQKNRGYPTASRQSNKISASSDKSDNINMNETDQITIDHNTEKQSRTQSSNQIAEIQKTVQSERSLQPVRQFTKKNSNQDLKIEKNTPEQSNIIYQAIKENDSNKISERNSQKLFNADPPVKRFKKGNFTPTSSFSDKNIITIPPPESMKNQQISLHHQPINKNHRKLAQTAENHYDNRNYEIYNKTNCVNSNYTHGQYCNPKNIQITMNPNNQKQQKNDIYPQKGNKNPQTPQTHKRRISTGIVNINRTFLNNNIISSVPKSNKNITGAKNDSIKQNQNLPISNQKVSITLNSLLINSYENKKSTAVSAHNLKKILGVNNYAPGPTVSSILTYKNKAI